MKRHVPAILALALALVGAVSPAASAGSGSYDLWTYDRRPAPAATSEPAQTLVSGQTRASADSLETTVTLAGEPDPAHDSRLHLAFGHTSDQGCVTDLERTVSTYAPDGGATRDGATLTVSMTTPWPSDPTQRCTSVTLTDPTTDAVLDRLDGRYDTTVISEPVRCCVILPRNTGPFPVPVDRWAVITLKVRDAQHSRTIAVTGHGRGVRALSVVAHPHGHRHIEVLLPVRLDRHRAEPLRVRLQGIDTEGDRQVGFSTSVTLRPRR